MSTQVDEAAVLLQELGNPTRLRIVRLLVRAGPDGVAVGDVQAHLQVPSSTLSHHLARLRGAGLVAQRRSGTTLYCSADYARLDALVAFLTDECCQGVSAPGVPATPRPGTIDPGTTDPGTTDPGGKDERGE